MDLKELHPQKGHFLPVSAFVEFLLAGGLPFFAGAEVFAETIHDLRIFAYGHAHYCGGSRRKI